VYDAVRAPAAVAGKRPQRNDSSGDDLDLASLSGAETDVQTPSSSPLRKKSRVADESISAFREVMGRFAPPDALTADEWFKKVGVTDEQRSALVALCAPSEPTALLLAMIEEEELATAMLAPLQLRAWKALAKKVTA